MPQEATQYKAMIMADLCRNKYPPCTFATILSRLTRLRHGSAIIFCNTHQPCVRNFLAHRTSGRTLILWSE